VVPHHRVEQKEIGDGDEAGGETKAAMAGTWKTGSYWGNFNDKFIALAPFGAGVSAKTKSAITARMAAIKNASASNTLPPPTIVASLPIAG
jgi:basic membrane lipoprotein Med (substrate-binding protein (PBP1-ABC) superfamily)